MIINGQSNVKIMIIIIDMDEYRTLGIEIYLSGGSWCYLALTHHLQHSVSRLQKISTW